MVSRQPIVPDRIRRIAGQGFSFIPHRFLREGFFASLTKNELNLYTFLVLAGDRHGISFYHYDRICTLLRIPLEFYIEARNALIHKDLIAFDGTRFQVLSLPKKPIHSSPKPLKTDKDFEDHDPATIRQILVTDLGLDQDRDS
ncbi:MAG: hypothetical protein MJE77_26275 [Proteobacteria bacterium]|nr:hypothetical protein [Pseudomonadota bacterium]